MIWQTKKIKMEECMQHVKLATFLRCIEISKDYPYAYLGWDEQTETYPVYVMENKVINLINGKMYPIIRETIVDKVDDICQIKIGEYQVHSLAPLPRDYTLEQRQLLYQQAKKIHESFLEKGKSKEKAYS